MKMANGAGSVYKLQGNRTKPYIIKKTIGWDINMITGKAKQKYIIIGYAQTKQEGIEVLRRYNQSSQPP